MANNRQARGPETLRTLGVTAKPLVGIHGVGCSWSRSEMGGVRGNANWDGLLPLCNDVIRRVAVVCCVPAHQFDDFAQEAWLTVLRCLTKRGFDSTNGRLENWLFVVVRNCAVTMFRHEWARSERRCEVPLDRIEASDCDSPAVVLDRVCTIRAVQSALRRLRLQTSTTAYAVFHLRHIDLFAVGDVALRMGLSRQQVRVYDHRARKKMTAILRRMKCSPRRKS